MNIWKSSDKTKMFFRTKKIKLSLKIWDIITFYPPPKFEIFVQGSNSLN